MPILYRLNPSYLSVKAKISCRRRFALYKNTGRGPFASLLRKLATASLKRRGKATPSFAEKLILNISKQLRHSRVALSEFRHNYRSDIEQRRMGRLGPCALLLFLTFSMLFSNINLFDFTLSVSINGEYMGTVSQRGQVEQLILDAEKHISDYSGSPYNVSANVSYNVVKTGSGTPVDPEKIRSMLFTSASQPNDIEYYELFIEGESLGLCKSRENLEMLLRRVALELAPGYESSKLGFAEDISILSARPDDSRLMDMQQLEALLRSEKKGAEYYTVKKGDTLSGIAVKHDLTRAQLKELNPDIDFDAYIHIGDVFMISDRVPYLTVTTTERKEYTEPVAFETLIEYDEERYVNESSLKREGTNGEAFVVADVECDLKGNVISRDIYSYTVTKEPVPQITLSGSKPLPPKVATGTFIQPSTGYLSSKTGYRPNLGDTHTGIDIANSVGTPIWASDGGTVIHAGWKGNYGLCVIIDHGNGYTTYYAHNSELLVEVGQKVAPHEYISLMGATGRVTGPHLHFEIRYNGKWQNPLNYFKFKY